MFRAISKKKLQEATVSSSSSDVDRDPVHVYCRLRPLQENIDSISCMKLLTPQEICLTSKSNGTRRDVSYKFKHVFTADASQKEIFDHVGYPLLEDLLKGKNGLLFTYGVTGSGKTFTLTGDKNNQGIIPRCINTVFNSIHDLQTPKFIIKSDTKNGFEIQAEEDAMQDKVSENRILKATKSERKLKADKNFINDVTMIPVFNENNAFAVFISYIEIYNNDLYDLLDESKKTLQNKILREDPNRNMYVNGVVEIEVKSAQEGFELFFIGQKRKKMAYTKLNSQSSRSHSVFNIRVVQLEKMPVNADGRLIIPEKNYLTVSQLSLVDLAGSERSSRTQNTGARLKEAGAINKSLMNLRTCLEVLRENQRSKAKKVVPYRDSRLTYLFKNYFEGDGSVQMIVCVNPTINDLEENLHVMKFAEMTQDVKVLKSEPKRTPIITKKRVAIPAKITKTTLFSTALRRRSMSCDEVRLERNYSIKPSSVLQSTMKKCKSVTKLTKASESENIPSKSKSSELNQINTELREQIRNLNQLLHRQQVKNNNLETKMNQLESKNSNLSGKNKELQDVIRSLHNFINEKDLKLNQNLLGKERTEPKIALASEKMGQELDAKLKKQRDLSNAAMNAMIVKEIQLKKVREALEADVVVNPRDIEIEYSEYLKVKLGRYNPKRRSKSYDEVRLEHNYSIKPAPLGTVLQPTMKKCKSVTKLTKASEADVVINPRDIEIENIPPKRKSSDLNKINTELREQIRNLKLTKASGKDSDGCGGGEARVIFNFVPTTGGGPQVIFKAN